jgi:hypothetical protein
LAIERFHYNAGTAHHTFLPPPDHRVCPISL